jgi:hypothetical protein
MEISLYLLIFFMFVVKLDLTLKNGHLHNQLNPCCCMTCVSQILKSYSPLFILFVLYLMLAFVYFNNQKGSFEIKTGSQISQTFVK